MEKSSRASRDPVASVLAHGPDMALLFGNGINRFSNNKDSSWDELLDKISEKQNVALRGGERQEMSNTELFDILDLAKPADDRRSLQRMFCDLMQHWKHTPQHSRVVAWALRHSTPIITVNFDENLSQSLNTRFFRQCGSPEGPRFTDFYPWRSYFGVAEITDPAKAFGIWHAHGMMRYSRSVRLGLTHYMGSVHRARSWIYRTDRSLIRFLHGKSISWDGMHTWLQPFFFSDIAIIGFSFKRDETFLRWLFLERARLHKRFPSHRKNGWFIVEENAANRLRRPFFKHLGIELTFVENHEQIYESLAWDQ
jgi:hypothetical protein